MTQPSSNSQAVTKDGCVKAGCSPSTRGCSDTIRVHMGCSLSWGTANTLQDREEPPPFHPCDSLQPVAPCSGKSARVERGVAGEGWGVGGSFRGYWVGCRAASCAL